MHVNDIASGRNWYTADSAKLITGPDWARWELHWNDGGLVHEVEDTEDEAVAALARYGFAPSPRQEAAIEKQSARSPHDGPEPAGTDESVIDEAAVRPALPSDSTATTTTMTHTTIAPAQPALASPAATRVRLVLDVTYVPGEQSPEEWAAKLRGEFEAVIDQGLISEVTKTEFSLQAKVRPEPLPEESIISFLQYRMENGSITAYDIPLLMARYGLKDPDDLMEEMRERMDHAEWSDQGEEEAEALPSPRG